MWKILVTTPINTINNIENRLDLIGELTLEPDLTNEDALTRIFNQNVVFTNPNKSDLYFDKKLLECFPNLKIIVTASTGTVHINFKDCEKRDIKVISLKNEKKFLAAVTSTAELAFTLTLMSIRNVYDATKSVISGKWDYSQFIGNQLSSMNFLVFGYGRLGTIYIDFLLPWTKNIYVYDPYVTVPKNKGIQIDDLDQILSKIDVIALHIHAENNYKFIGKEILSKCKNGVNIINTSRGEIVDESIIIDLIKSNKIKYATDVIDEEHNYKNSELLKLYKKSQKNLIITPHIAGMSHQAMELAYNRVIDLFKNFINV